MLRKYEKGFTLLEIIATISLILVVMSMAVPMYTNIVDKQKLKSDLATAMQLNQCAKTFYIENKNGNSKDLEKYIKEVFEEMPKSKYFNKEFEINFQKGKPNIFVGKFVFIKDGKAKEIEDIDLKNINSSNENS